MFKRDDNTVLFDDKKIGIIGKVDGKITLRVTETFDIDKDVIKDLEMFMMACRISDNNSK